MTRPFSTPHVAPLYKALPYHYRGVRKISAYCRCDPDALRAFLPDDFELLGDVCEVFQLEAPDAGPLGHYSESGVVIPMTFDGTPGAHVALEYVSSDDSLAAGREIWGYPKKMAEVPFRSLENGGFESSTIRRGTTIISMTFTPGGDAFEKPVMQPRFQIKTFATADGTGWDLYQVIRNDLANVEVRDHQFGTVELELKGSDNDPLDRLGVESVIGAESAVIDFLLQGGRIVKSLDAA
uniref:acetoacetate decarboxylase family protein n=1 Tax=Roseovarius indicus TaxID=540747 RepID=UPI003B51B47B